MQAQKRKQCGAWDTKEYGELSEGPHAERVPAARLEKDVWTGYGSATVARRANDQAVTVLNERILRLPGFLSWGRGIGVLSSDTRAPFRYLRLCGPSLHYTVLLFPLGLSLPWAFPYIQSEVPALPRKRESEGQNPESCSRALGLCSRFTTELGAGSTAVLG